MVMGRFLFGKPLEDENVNGSDVLNAMRTCFYVYMDTIIIITQFMYDLQSSSLHCCKQTRKNFSFFFNMF